MLSLTAVMTSLRPVFVSFVLASVSSASPVPTTGGTYVASSNLFGAGAYGNIFGQPYRVSGGHQGQSHGQGQYGNHGQNGYGYSGKDNSGNGYNGQQNYNGNAYAGQNNNQASGNGNAVGAAYRMSFLDSGAFDSSLIAFLVITNEPDGNMILSANIAQDGTLTFGSAVATGGAGAHGLADLFAPDPLFAQGAVKVSAAAQMLATVNVRTSYLLYHPNLI